MKRRHSGVPLVVLLAGLMACSAAGLAQERPSYKWTMPVEETASFDALTYHAGAITVAFAEGHRAPIVIQLPDEAGQEQPAVTGLQVLAQGTVKVEHGGEVLFEDDIYSAMFRFHPDDYEAFIAIEGKQPQPEAGLRSLLVHICYGSFRRFWHRGMEAFVPDPSVGAAFVHAKQHGGVMLWQNETELVGYCMDTQTELFRR